MKITGKMSTFGGPHDTGVAANEGLGIIELCHLKDPRISALFLPRQPDGTTGLARRLDPSKFYLAMRWDYKRFSKDHRSTSEGAEYLRGITVTVSANGKSVEASPVDWGPNEHTGRIADLSPGLAHALGLSTDDLVTIEIPEPCHCI